MLSEEHADPEWTAMPARSRPMRTGSASTPATPRHTRWGSLSSTPGPTTSTPSTAERGLHHGVDLSSRRGGLRVDRPVRQGRGAGAESQERGQCLQPGTAPALLFAAHQEGGEPAPSPDDQRSGTGHPTELVRADAHEVGVQRGEIHGHVATGGGGIHVDRDPGFAAQLDHGLYRLQRADLMVPPLAVHQGRARSGARVQPVPKCVDVDPSRAVHPDVLGGCPARRRVACRRVLHGGTEDGRPAGCLGRTPYGSVDGLGRTRGEDHLACGHADEIGHPAAGRLERVAHDTTLFVHPARIGRRQRGPVRQGGDRRRPRRSGAGVIEIGARHRCLRQRRCRRRRPAPARRGSPGGPAVTPSRTGPTTAP